MARLIIDQISVLSDNYIYLAHDPATGATAVIDPAEAAPVLKRAEDLGWRISHILNTHHHGDHTGGNLAIKQATGCTIVGARKDAARIPGIDLQVSEGEVFLLGSAAATVLEVPGHTVGHIAYWFKESDALFCGDTIFALGCGRLFEGSPQQMWHSLAKLRQLPPETWVYCAHEYTESNARFARTVERDNQALLERILRVKEARARNKPTVPSQLSEEAQTNPFLRADQDSVARAVGLPGGQPVDVFAEIRRRKDAF